MNKQHNNPYAHIKSLKELRQEEIKLRYQLTITEKSMALKVMELKYELDPERLMMHAWENALTFFIRLFKKE